MATEPQTSGANSPAVRPTWWQRTLPPTQWLRTYTWAALVWDLFAGLSVALTLVPQSLAYASLAGLDKSYGLYSAYIGCIGYALLGTAKDVSVGPVAVVSLLVSEVIEITPEDEVPTTLALLTFYVGSLQLVLYLFRLGSILDLISHPVLVGFTSASAITIAMKQVNNLLGVSIASSSNFLQNVIALVPAIKDTNGWALLMGGLSLLILVILRKLWPIFPRNAAVVTVATLFTWGFQLDQAWDLRIVGILPEGLPGAIVPDFGKTNTVLPSALAITIVALLEHIAVAKALSRRAGLVCDSTQELLALGAVNTAGSFAYAMPVTGSFSRSTLAQQSGAKTPFNSSVSGFIALISVLFLTSAFQYIPETTLAAVIIAAVVVMVEPSEMVKIIHLDRRDAATMLVTFVGVLCVGAEFGIFVGILFAIFGSLYAVARPPLVLLRQPTDDPNANGADDPNLRSSAKVASPNPRDVLLLPSAASTPSSFGTPLSNSVNEVKPPPSLSGWGWKLGAAPFDLEDDYSKIAECIWQPDSQSFYVRFRLGASVLLQPPAVGSPAVEQRPPAALPWTQRTVRVLQRLWPFYPSFEPGPIKPLPWAEVPLLAGYLVVQVQESVWFPNTSYLLQELLSIFGAARQALRSTAWQGSLVQSAKDSPGVAGLILDMPFVSRLDSSGCEMLLDLHHELARSGALLVLAGLRPTVAADLSEAIERFRLATEAAEKRAHPEIDLPMTLLSPWALPRAELEAWAAAAATSSSNVIGSPTETRSPSPPSPSEGAGARASTSKRWYSSFWRRLPSTASVAPINEQAHAAAPTEATPLIQ